ncbi:aromatic ring-hydroxylating oxygenase subunit alpha [Microcoleus vaginatus]|uniref:aromatic ring-hydroxylating oxygenase subunit alpha n=1 Tax=Microcoleus vaginatus TaxID=119532 RepID=UPI0016892830|nr:aromatic ring-hydroxylating dioxygenase subunit alpha [Microcoleus sp. FACHB-84]MBD2009825.1 aromatic ring-hydroxylating dioxygenase subunit alpha [Microcoleus sp. FACHB-45]
MQNNAIKSVAARGQKTHIRQLGINLDRWYAIARTTEVQTQPVAAKIWNRAIVLFRDSSGKINALEDRCPHRQVKLSHGKVKGDLIECAYHGWRLNARGECAEVDYLAENQKLPNCKIRSYPVKEQNGFIWLFPGDETQAEKTNLLDLPEWEHLNYIATVSVIDCQAHYSFLIENLMDMYHGHLHDDWQAWANPVLDTLEENEHQVTARYQAQSYYKIDKIWSISQLFFKSLRRLHPEPLEVSYIYPHWVSTLGSDFKIYCLVCPVSETATRAYLIHFTSLNAFWRLHKLPVWFRRFIKDSCFGAAQKLLDGLVRQDVLMIEEEQQAFLQNSERKSYELNRALASVQKLMRSQAENG